MSEVFTLFGREVQHAPEMRAGHNCPECSSRAAIALDQYQRGETRHRALYRCQKCRARFGRVWGIQ